MNTIAKYLFIVSAMLFVSGLFSFSYAAPTLRSFSEVTSLTGVEPTGATQDDLLVAYVKGTGNNTALVGPTGWTEVTKEIVSFSSPRGVGVWYIVRGISAPSYTWTGPSGAYIVVTAWTGADSVNPINVYARTTATTSTPSSPSVTTTVSNTALVSVAMNNGALGQLPSSIPSGMTSIQSNGTSRIYSARQDIASSGATGTRQWTFAGSDIYYLVSFAIAPGSSAPTITVNPSASYGSYTRTGVSNTPWTMSFTATDAEQTGANALTYYVHTGANRTGTQVATGTFTSGAASPTIAYNATGMAAGSNTLYLSVYDGALYSATNPSFTVLRDDDNPSATSISHSPNPVTVTTQYTTTFTANDTTSRSTNELRWWVRTATGGGGTNLINGTLTWSGTPTTTGTITDSALVDGANTRYVRVCDGANNCTDNSFTVTASIVPPTVTTSAVSGLTVTDAILNGSANPNGKAATGWFRYYTTNPGTCSDSGGTRAPTSGGTSLGSGSTGVAYSQSITGLTSGTTYYSCAFSSNSDGTGVGTVVSFTPAGGGTCSSVPTSGDYTMSTSCVFGAGTSTYDGLDLGSGVSNTAVLTISSGKAMTVGGGQTIAYGSISKPGASIVKFSGGVLRKGPLWVPDTDGDGYPDSASPANTWSLTQPAGYVRRSFVGNNISLTDCSTNNANTFQNQTVATDADQDGYGTSSASSQCAGSSTTVSGRTYYKNSSAAFAFIATGSMLGTSDCYDTSAAPCPPTGVSASGASASQMNVSWSAATGPAQTSYNLVWCSGASCTPSNTLVTVTSPYAHTGRTCGTTYGYNIIAVNAAGSSTASSTAYGATSSCASAPSATTNAATSIGGSTVTLNGTFAMNGGTSNVYWFRYGTTNTGNCSTLSTATTTTAFSTDGAKSKAVTGLNGNTTYYFCAAASNSVGTTYSSSILSFTTICFQDSDGDTYGNPSVTGSCGAGYVSNNTDCYDSNANAKPGQTSYFTSNRGDGSFDYDCDSITTRNPFCGSGTCTIDDFAAKYTLAPSCTLQSASNNYFKNVSNSSVVCGTGAWAGPMNSAGTSYTNSACTISKTQLETPGGGPTTQSCR